MMALEAVAAAMNRWPKPRLEGSTVIVPTHCLYPTNHVIHVYVEPGEHEFLVHDNGNALDQLRAMGGHESTPAYLIRSAVRRDGLQLSQANHIYAPHVRFEGLEAAISLVANAARDAADYLIANHRPHPRRPLGEELEAILNIRFPSLWRKEEVIVGQSNKQHGFDYIVAMSNDKRLLIETVKPDASSINAAVVAHLDVRNSNPTGFIQRIVYNDGDSWPSESLSLLRVGAIPVALSAANDALTRLAA